MEGQLPNNRLHSPWENSGMRYSGPSRTAAPNRQPPHGIYEGYGDSQLLNSVGEWDNIFDPVNIDTATIDPATIDPALLTPNNEVAQPRDEEIAAMVNPRNSYEPPWPSRMVGTQGAMPEYNNLQRYDARSGPSTYAHSHAGDRSLFSPSPWDSTTNTTNELGHQHSGGARDPSMHGSLAQEQSECELEVVSPTYAAVVRGESSGPRQNGNDTRHPRGHSNSGQHLSVPGYPEPMSNNPPPTPSSTYSAPPAEVPEVLLCLRDGCRQTFKGKYRLGNRARHMRTKHGSGQYDCNLCGKPYRRSDARLKHLRKAHPGSVADPVSRN